MENWQYLWAGIGLTLLILPIIQWNYCRIPRITHEKHYREGWRFDSRKPEKEEDEAVNLKFTHLIIIFPVCVGFIVTVFFVVLPSIQGNF